MTVKPWIKDMYLFIVCRTALFDSTNPIKHDVITVCLKEIRRPTSGYHPKHVFLVAIVIHNVNNARPHADCKYVSCFLTT